MYAHDTTRAYLLGILLRAKRDIIRVPGLSVGIDPNNITKIIPLGQHFARHFFAPSPHGPQFLLRENTPGSGGAHQAAHTRGHVARNSPADLMVAEPNASIACF